MIISWTEALSDQNLPATTLIRTSKITTAGILDTLEETQAWSGAAQLQILNGELEKVVNKKRDAYLQESDLIELLDGSDSFGSSTGKKRVCLRPNVWMFIGTQLQTYIREFGAASKGRLRLVVQALDSAQVFETPFEDKFVPRKCSNDLLIGVLQAILVTQQKPKEPAHGDPARGPPPAHWQQAGPREVPPGTNWLSNASNGTRRARGRVRRQRRREQTDDTEEAMAPPPPPPVVVPEINNITWDPAAGSVFAGLNEGAAAAMRKYQRRENQNRGGEGVSGSFNSTVTKHAGKAFGACCVGNLAIRNGLLRWAVPNAPQDATIRMLDALAGLAKTELYGINQIRLDRLLRLHEQREARRYGTNEDEGLEDAEGHPGDTPEWLKSLTPAELALRKLIDAIGESHELHWEPATTDSSGIPYKVSQGSCWFNFRQHNFSRKRIRMLEKFHHYGGIENLNDHGCSTGWKAMLTKLVENSVAVNTNPPAGAREPTGNPAAVVLRKTRAGRDFLSKIHASEQALQLYDALPNPLPEEPQ